MVSFVRKDGRPVRLRSLSESGRMAATKRAAAKRTLKRRMQRLQALPPSTLYPIARGHYGISRSPRVATRAGRPIKAGITARQRTQTRFIRELKKDPTAAAAFLSGMFGKR